MKDKFKERREGKKYGEFGHKEYHTGSLVDVVLRDTIKKCLDLRPAVGNVV